MNIYYFEREIIPSDVDHVTSKRPGSNNSTGKVPID